MVIGAVLAAILPAKVAGEVTDCAAFDCQVWAQSVYVLDRPGYGALDPDASGGACEELSPGAAPALWSDQVPAGAVPATFSRITDGDTIRVVANGREEPVRLILIDTPETHDPNDPAECYGQEATASTTWLFSLGGQHYLESDVTDQDRYDRLLRYAWLDLGDGEVYLVNETVVRAGYGALSTYPPDVKYVDQIRAANAFAREHGYGLWSACQSDAEGTRTNSVVDRRRRSPLQSNRSLATRVRRLGATPIIPTPVSRLHHRTSTAGIHRRFTVLPPDPRNVDGDFNGIGCECGSWFPRSAAAHSRSLQERIAARRNRLCRGPSAYSVGSRHVC